MRSKILKPIRSNRRREDCATARKQPEGVVPKQSQAYVIAGLAVLILLAALFSKSHPPASKSAPSLSVSPAAEVNERKIEDLNEELNRAQHASGLATPNANDVPQLGKAPSPQAGAPAASLSTPDQQRDAIKDAERELLFKSRFASNLVSEQSSHLPVAAQEAQRLAGSPSTLESEPPALTNPKPAAANRRPPEINVNAAHGQPLRAF